MNAQIIAIANQKGGVGKITTCANLGVWFGSLGYAGGHCPLCRTGVSKQCRLNQNRKENIEYDCLISNPRQNRERLNEVVDLITETLCFRKRYIVVSGDKYSAELIKDKASNFYVSLNTERDNYCYHLCRKVG